MKTKTSKTLVGIAALALMAPTFAFANTDVKVSAYASASTTPAQRTCMQTATSLRADAHVAALDTLFASFRSAFIVRKNATVAAWGNEDGSARAAALVSANTTFASSVKTGWKNFRTTRAAADATYKTSVVACDIEKTKVSDNDKKDHNKDKKNVWGKVRANINLFNR